MNPQVAAPSTTGFAAPAPAQATAVSPSGAPGVPGVPQGTMAPTVAPQAPTSFDTQGMTNAIANYYQIPKATALANAGVEGNKFNATTAYEGQLQATSEFAKQRLSASAYKILNTKNGVQILDPVTGQTIDNATYVNRTGSEGFNTLLSALNKSPNQRDQQFVSDYNNFQTYMNAAVNAKYDANGKPQNEAANVAQAYQKDNPQLASMNPQQAAQAFLKEYGDYLGVTPTAQTPAHALYTPTLSQNEINYMLSRTLYSGNPPAGNTGLDFSYLLGGTPASSTPATTPVTGNPIGTGVKSKS